jgi:predicted transcriptional regulator
MTEDGSGGDGQPIEDILDTIGDPYARDVLAAICREPQSASELAEDLGYSSQTVYRRIEVLQEHDLVSERTRIADDGNHHKVYDSSFDGALISVDDAEYDVEIYRREDLPERFGNLWDDLSMA